METWILFVIVSGSISSTAAIPGFDSESSCLFSGNRLVANDSKDQWQESNGNASPYKIVFRCFPAGPKAAEKR